MTEPGDPDLDDFIVVKSPNGIAKSLSLRQLLDLLREELRREEFAAGIEVKAQVDTLPSSL